MPLISFAIERTYFLPVLLQTLKTVIVFPLQQPLVYSRFHHILSSEPCSGDLISLTLSLQTTLPNCWLIKLLSTRLSSVKLHFLKVSCTEVGTYLCETCLVVNKSKYFPYFSGSSFLPATPDHIYPLLNSFISRMELQLPDLQPTDSLLYTCFIPEVSQTKFVRVIVSVQL